MTAGIVKSLYFALLVTYKEYRPSTYGQWHDVAWLGQFVRETGEHPVISKQSFSFEMPVVRTGVGKARQAMCDRCIPRKSPQ